ncbi:MAG TPA: translation initiation factor IF-2 N-terminal domain-containing protein, partial [Acidimicrobiia bacterium]|nr:translation initiation factor IF-2 N-terminal domain-containing protein [Acidimicrobiia bacterium]
MRVYELAKDLGIDSKDLLLQAHDLGIEVKTASSGLDDESAELLRLAVAGDEPEVVEAEPEPEVEEEVASEAAPVSEVELDIASIPSGASVTEFADALGVPAKDVVAQLMTRGQAVGAGQTMPPELIEDVAENFGFIVDIESPPPPPAVAERPVFEDADSELAPRPP